MRSVAALESGLPDRLPCRSVRSGGHLAEPQCRCRGAGIFRDLLNRPGGFQKSPVFQLLPEQLATSGEACAHLRHYFRGGVPELREKLEAAQRGLDAVRAVVNSIEKTVW